MAPEGWQKARLKDLISGSVKNGYSPLPSKRETGYWVMGLGALGEDGLVRSQVKPVQPNDKVNASLLKEGDFLVSRSNTPNKVGRSIRYRGEIPNCSYPDLMMRFRVNNNVADANFIEQKLKSFPLRQYFKRSAAGSSNSMVKINKSILEATPIDLPPLPEQRRIGKILATWDKAIATTEQLLANSERQKKGLMQQLLTGRERLPGFKKAWEEKKLADLCQINPPRSTEPPDRKVSFIPMDAVSEEAKVVRTEDRNYSTVANGFTSFMDGDVLIAKITPCFENGKGAYLKNLTNGVGFGSTEFHVLRAREGVSAAFIYFLTVTSKFRVRGEANMQGSAGQKRVATNYLKALRIHTPPFEEQKRIASILTAADKKTEILQERINCLKMEKKSLMQQLLTGKRRVEVANNEITAAAAPSPEDYQEVDLSQTIGGESANCQVSHPTTNGVF